MAVSDASYGIRRKAGSDDRFDVFPKIFARLQRSVVLLDPSKSPFAVCASSFGVLSFGREGKKSEKIVTCRTRGERTGYDDL